MRPGWYGFEEHQLDGVFVRRKRRWRWSGLPPQQHASTGGDAEHEGKDGNGAWSPLGGYLLEQRGSRGANLQRLRRLLRWVIVGIAHLQTIGTARVA